MSYRGLGLNGRFNNKTRKLLGFRIERAGEFPNNRGMKASRTLAFLLLSSGIALAQEPASLSSLFNSDAPIEPLAASSASLAFQYVVAHFPYGGGWSTQVMLANSGTQTASGNITFFNEAGASTSVPLSGKGLASSDQFSVAPNDVTTVGAESSARNSGGLEVAWGIVASSQPLNVFSLFDFGPNFPAISGAVGAQSTTAQKVFQFPVLINGEQGYNAGMAIANPNSSTTDVTITVYNSSGSKQGSFQETLQANNQTIFTLTQKMNFSSSLFTGSVAVCATQPIGLVTVGFEGGQAFFTTSVTNPTSCPQ